MVYGCTGTDASAIVSCQCCRSIITLWSTATSGSDNHQAQQLFRGPFALLIKPVNRHVDYRPGRQLSASAAEVVHPPPGHAIQPLFGLSRTLEAELLSPSGRAHALLWSVVVSVTRRLRQRRSGATPKGMGVNLPNCHRKARVWPAFLGVSDLA